MPNQKPRVLFLIRHAKSSWKTGHDDPHRPLSKRGLRDAPEMGRRLARGGVEPDLMVTSSAVRARVTATLVAGELGYNPVEIRVAEGLYLASLQQWCGMIAALPDECRVVMLFGNNTGITELAQRLYPRMGHMPTCAVAGFHYQLAPETDSWALLEQADPQRILFDFPKNECPPDFAAFC